MTTAAKLAEALPDWQMTDDQVRKLLTQCPLTLASWMHEQSYLCRQGER